MAHLKQREDSTVHQGKRNFLVEELREKGITDQRVLDAIKAVPRHFFLDAAFEHYAYENRTFPIPAGQTISHPFTVAHQTELLELKKFDKVLEVGTGSAYQACILAELGVTVYTIERQRELYDHTGKFFLLKKYPNIKRFFGDGYAGLPTYAPFDKIIVTAGAPFVPPNLMAQLKVGGIMVIPVGDDSGQKMLKIVKTAENEQELSETGEFAFVPMLEGKSN